MGMKERAIWLQETALRVGNDIWNETSRASAQSIHEVQRAGPAVSSGCLVTRLTDIRLSQQQPPRKLQQAPKSQIKYSQLTDVLLISQRVRRRRDKDGFTHTHKYPALSPPFLNQTIQLPSKRPKINTAIFVTNAKIELVITFWKAEKQRWAIFDFFVPAVKSKRGDYGEFFNRQKKKKKQNWF